jgi:CheY-like chemotaxis protein
MAHVLVAQCVFPMTKMLTEILNLEGYRVAQVNAGEQMYEALLVLQ